MSEQREHPDLRWDPPAVYLGDHAPGTEAWAAARRGGLGGSEIAAILGLSPFESRFSLWHRKRSMIGSIDDRPELEWGRRFEDAVALKFADEHPEYTVLPGGAWRSTEHPWMIAHPDRLLVRTDTHGHQHIEVYEGKIAIHPDGWGEHGTDEIPVYYRAQVFHYLRTLGLRRAHLAVNILGGLDYREYIIDLDDTEQAEIETKCVEFLRTVSDNERPDIDSHTATYEALRDMHPDIDPESITLTGDVGDRYLNAIAAYKTAEAEKRHATSLVADEMGNAQAAWHNERKVAIRTAKTGGTPYVKSTPLPKTITTSTRGDAAA